MALDDLAPAEPQDEAQRRHEGELSQGRVESVEPLRLDGVVGHALVLALEPALLVVLGGKGPDHPDARQVLLQDRAELAHLLVRAQPDAPHPQPEYRRLEGRGGQEAHADEAEAPVELQQEHGHAYEQSDEVRSPDDAHVYEHADTLHVGDGAGHQVARVLPVVEAEAHALDVVEKQVAQPVGDTLCECLSEVGLAVRQQAPRRAQRDDRPDRQNDRLPGDLACPCGRGDGVDGAPYHLGKQQVGEGGAGHGRVGGRHQLFVGERHAHDAHYFSQGGSAPGGPAGPGRTTKPQAGRPVHGHEAGTCGAVFCVDSIRT